MKKYLLFTFFVGAFLVLSNSSSKANPFIQSATFDFPTDIVLGDTVDVSMYIDLFIIDSSMIGNPVNVIILLANDVDTVSLCEGSVEIKLPGTLIYQFRCVLPDTTGLGDHNLVIIIQTPFGDFVMGGGHPLTVRGDHDLNQDGSMDISDLIAMVNYMFNEGSSPLPSISNADFNCDQTLDIADLITQVSYMFSGGSLPCMEIPTQ